MNLKIKRSLAYREFDASLGGAWKTESPYESSSGRIHHVGTAVDIVLTAATLASFAPVLDRMRVISLVADFHSALSRARHEAVRRGQRVDLLPLAVGDWRSGWCVAIDANNNQHIDAGELVLHCGAAALPAGVEITARMTDSKRIYLAFDPSGRPRTAASASVPQYGSVLFQLGEQRRKLLIGFLGRVRVCDPDRDGAAC
jgi:type IV fimbrial biogenesis protein FimT